jgi:hypothetical protein
MVDLFFSLFFIARANQKIPNLALGRESTGENGVGLLLLQRSPSNCRSPILNKALEMIAFRTVVLDRAACQGLNW